MKLKATLLLVTLLAALACVSGRRFYSPHHGNGDRRSIRVKTVVSWVCKLLRKLQINSTETLCNHLHPPPPLPYTMRPPYRTTWRPYPSTWRPYTWRPYPTTRRPYTWRPHTWRPYPTTRSPYRTTWSPFRTTWNPYRSTWRPYRTSWRPYRTSWSPYRTTWSPYRTTWSPYRTSWRPYRTSWSPYRTTRNPYRTSWRPHGTTWYPENTRFDFITGWPRTTVSPEPVATSTGFPWPMPGRSFASEWETLEKVEKLTATFTLMGRVLRTYKDLIRTLEKKTADEVCGDLADIINGKFRGRRRTLPEEVTAAVAFYYKRRCVQQPETPVAPPHNVPEIVKPVGPVSGGQCGHSLKLRKLTKASRIVGGENTGSCDVIPWQVRVKSQMGLCGGSIISNHHILTAAHCVNEITSVNQVSVVVGDYNTEQTESSEQAHTVKKVTFHDQFNISSYANDVALLTLDQPVNLTNPCVQPVCRNASFVPNNMLCTVSGWGTTSSGGKTSETLQMVQVLTFKGTECMSEFSIPKNYRDYMTNKDKQLCAGKVGGGQDSCQGDSGGPLVCLHPDSKTFIQVGIVSYGVGCAAKGFPGVYSSVAAFNDWIEMAMAQTSHDLP